MRFCTKVCEISGGVATNFWYDIFNPKIRFRPCIWGCLAFGGGLRTSTSSRSRDHASNVIRLNPNLSETHLNMVKPLCTLCAISVLSKRVWIAVTFLIVSMGVCLISGAWAETIAHGLVRMAGENCNRRLTRWVIQWVSWFRSISQARQKVRWYR